MFKESSVSSCINQLSFVSPCNYMFKVSFVSPCMFLFSMFSIPLYLLCVLCIPLYLLGVLCIPCLFKVSSVSPLYLLGVLCIPLYLLGVLCIPLYLLGVLCIPLYCCLSQTEDSKARGKLSGSRSCSIGTLLRQVWTKDSYCFKRAHMESSHHLLFKI